MTAPQLFDEGDNYRIDLERDVSGRFDVLLVKVWKREDLSSAEGADLAARMTDALLRAMRVPGVHAVILDLSDAPPVVGPKTSATIGALIEQAATLKHGVRIVASATAMGRLQLERLARDHGAEGAVVSSLAAARAPRRA